MIYYLLCSRIIQITNTERSTLLCNVFFLYDLYIMPGLRDSPEVNDKED